MYEGETTTREHSRTVSGSNLGMLYKGKTFTEYACIIMLQWPVLAVGGGTMAARLSQKC